MFSETSYDRMLFTDNRFSGATGALLITAIVLEFVTVAMVVYVSVKDFKPPVGAIGILSFISGKSLSKQQRVTFCPLLSGKVLRFQASCSFQDRTTAVIFKLAAS